MALSDAAGDTVQTYEYSVYGEVAVEDANHPNPYMFAGVRYDIEIGLYYNRARYYNPFTGRFLQTDPIGYGDGMNWYAYCRNNPLNYADPTGQWASYEFVWRENETQHVMVLCKNGDGSLGTDFYFADWGTLLAYMESEEGDFCDVSVDDTVPSFSFTESVPDYGTMCKMAEALGAESPSQFDYDRIRTDVIIRNAEQSPWRYISGFNGGEFDPAATDPSGKYVVDGLGVLTASEFGNYLAGYAGYYHFGLDGVGAAALGGAFYAGLWNVSKVYANLASGRPMLEGVPDGGVWLDPLADQYMIVQGWKDAEQKIGLL